MAGTARKATAEITDADIDRVDAVDEPATGLPFIMLKSTTAPTADPANVPGAEPVVKADGESEPEAGGEAIDAEDPATETDPGSAAWEAVDAAKARDAVNGLLAVRALINFLCEREGAEGEADEVYGLSDALCALDCALSTLTVFAATEQQEADQAAAAAEAEARALGLIKSLNLSEKEPPVATEPTKAELLKQLETDIIVKAQEAGIEDASLMGIMVRKAQNDDLPTGVIDLLNQIVAVMNAIDDVTTSVDEAAQSPVDTGDGDDLGAPAPSQPDAPVDDAMTQATAEDAATDTPDAPADQPIADAADAPAPAADDAPADGDAPADDTDDDDSNPFAKAMDAFDQAANLRAIQRNQHMAAAVDDHRAAHHLPSIKKASDDDTSLEDRIAAAVAAAVAPLKKQIKILEETPVEPGFLMSGHVPGMVGQNPGQGKGPSAEADILKSAAATGDPGKQIDAVVGFLKAQRNGRTF